MTIATQNRNVIIESDIAEETLVFSTPREALNFIVNQKSFLTDLILLDLHSKEMSIALFIEELEKSKVNYLPPIGVLSNSIFDDSLEDLMHNPLVLDVVLKPLTKEALFNLVRKIDYLKTIKTEV